MPKELHHEADAFHTQSSHPNVSDEQQVELQSEDVAAFAPFGGISTRWEIGSHVQIYFEREVMKESDRKTTYTNKFLMYWDLV